MEVNIAEAHGLGAHHVYGIGHGIGLRFEEPPPQRSSRLIAACPSSRA